MLLSSQISIFYNFRNYFKISNLSLSPRAYILKTHVINPLLAKHPKISMHHIAHSLLFIYSHLAHTHTHTLIYHEHIVLYMKKAVYKTRNLLLSQHISMHTHICTHNTLFIYNFYECTFFCTFVVSDVCVCVVYKWDFFFMF